MVLARALQVAGLHEGIIILINCLSHHAVRLMLA